VGNGVIVLWRRQAGSSQTPHPSVRTGFTFLRQKLPSRTSTPPSLPVPRCSSKLEPPIPDSTVIARSQHYDDPDSGEIETSRYLAIRPKGWTVGEGQARGGILVYVLSLIPR